MTTLCCRTKSLIKEDRRYHHAVNKGCWQEKKVRLRHRPSPSIWWIWGQACSSYRNGPRTTLCAFDLIQIDGEDLRWRPIEVRKGMLKTLICNEHPGIPFNRHFDIEGSIVFHHACKLGCEGVVSKRLGSPYRFRPVERLAQGQEPGRARGEARGGRGLGRQTIGPITYPFRLLARSTRVADFSNRQSSATTATSPPGSRVSKPSVN
jgi:ATP dependent DNA ligase domain